ncbi:IS630 transposase-related protein [Orientia tsutsugamushi]|uniref:IS630 transposase-related protein n=1 Tax=Orientia tsutsugamushi TaxID=784 RepID=UPI003527D9B7
MSTRPYSQDLREKVINYIEKGNSQISASRWNVRKKKEEIILAKARLGFKSKVDKQQLEEFIKNNSSIKIKDIGKKLEITGTQVGRILKKLGYKKLQPFGRKCIETI